jgi:hypothetical protein
MVYQVGAACYALWGLLHIGAAVQGFRLAGSVQDAVIKSRLQQNAWHLGIFAFAAIFVAATMNWQNSATGYWINLVMVSAVDVGFVILVASPGHIERRAAIAGPALWILAAIFSTWGFLTYQTT